MPSGFRLSVIIQIILTLFIEFGVPTMLPNDTETRTFKKYLGYYLSKYTVPTVQINGIPILTTNALSPALPGPFIVTSGVSAPVLPSSSFQSTFDIPTTRSEPTSSSPGSTPLSVFTIAPSSTTASPSQISSAATISPDTANFPIFESDPDSPSATIGPPPNSLAVRPFPSVTIGPPPSSFRASPSPFPTAPPSNNDGRPMAMIDGTQSAANASGLPTGLTGGVFQASDVQSLAQGFNIPTATNTIGPQQCSCVPIGTCVSSNGIGGRIDLRIITQNPGMPCGTGLQYCCTQGTNAATTSSCGTQNIIQGVNPGTGQASFGEFPWSGIIINSANQYVGGAALIDSTHLLTVAHLVSNYGNGAGLRVRLGEWDLAGTYEPFAYVDINVLNIIIHPRYEAGTLRNDLAVISLVSAPSILVNPTPQVNTACLPGANDVYTGQTCFVAGWGRDSFTGSYQSIIKEVGVAIMGNQDCQQRLQRTKLGSQWQLDTTSFICAGGEANRDSCTGDGGNALVCQRNGRYYVAGVTAGGVECGLQGVPGLYTNIASYLNWIQTQTGGTNGNGALDPRNLG